MTGRVGTVHRISLAILMLSLILTTSEAVSEPASRAAMRPSLVRLAPGAECRFRVVLSPKWLQPAVAAAHVEWTVNGTPGGDERVGFIDASGKYTAPKSVSRAREIVVGAFVKEAANPVVWGTVIVGDGDVIYKQTAAWQETVPDKPTGLAMPLALVLDRDGSAWIPDGGHVFRYSMDGRLIARFGVKKEGDPAPVVGPRDVAIGLDDRVYICDAQTGPPRIKVFNRNAERVGGFAPKGIGPGMVMQSQGMAIDHEGKRLLVADSENMRINVYSVDGELLAMWDRTGVMPGQFAEPYGVVIDRNGDVFVPNHYGPCQKFTSEGDYLFSFAEPDPPDGVVTITSIAGDRWGNVYLAVRDSAGIPNNSVDPEPKPARILKFNNSGDHITTIALWDDEKSENKMAVGGDDRLHVMFRRGDAVGMATFESE